MIPIAVSETEAADMLGIGRTLFRDLVGEGHLPKPRKVPGRRRQIWDVDELRTAYRCWVRDGEDSDEFEDEGEDW